MATKNPARNRPPRSPSRTVKTAPKMGKVKITSIKKAVHAVHSDAKLETQNLETASALTK